MPMHNADHVWYSWDLGNAHFVSLATDAFIMGNVSKGRKPCPAAQAS